VTKFCAAQGIAHQGLGPIIFYAGFTSEAIKGPPEDNEKRRQAVKSAVDVLAKGKRFVVVDGVGYPAVGSVAGVSNAQVAAVLNAPVMIVGRPGVGDAVDSLNMAIAYFEKFGARVAGALFNNISPVTCYHSAEDCRDMVSLYMHKYLPSVAIAGFIPRHDALWAAQEEEQKAKAANGASCVRRVKQPAVITPDALALSDSERALCSSVIDWFDKHAAFTTLLERLKTDPAADVKQ